MTKILTIAPNGYVIAANVHKFKEELIQAVKSEEYSGLLVDFQQVKFVDSSGLMALVSAFKLAQSLDRRFSICSVGPAVKMILELSQLDKVLEIFENRDDFELAIS